MTSVEYVYRIFPVKDASYIQLSLICTQISLDRHAHKNLLKSEFLKHIPELLIFIDSY